MLTIVFLNDQNARTEIWFSIPSDKSIESELLSTASEYGEYLTDDFDSTNNFCPSDEENGHSSDRLSCIFDRILEAVYEDLEGGDESKIDVYDLNLRFITAYSNLYVKQPEVAEDQHGSNQWHMFAKLPTIKVTVKRYIDKEFALFSADSDVEYLDGERFFIPVEAKDLIATKNILYLEYPDEIQVMASADWLRANPEDECFLRLIQYDGFQETFMNTHSASDSLYLFGGDLLVYGIDNQSDSVKLGVSWIQTDENKPSYFNF